MTFEDRLFPEPAAARPAAEKQFREDMADIFGTEEGRRVLARLCMAQHPLAHVDGMTAHQHGNAEVVAMIWRYGSQSNSLPPIQPETTP